MSHTAPQIPIAAVGAVRNESIDLTDELDAGELLSGTPVIDEQTTNHLTIVNKVISTGELTILNVAVATAKAVQCTISGFQAGTDYVINGTITTDSVPAQTIPFKIRITGESA